MGGSTEKGKYTSPEGSATWEYIATMCCSLMIFSVGCSAGWSSPALPILMSPDSPSPLSSSDASTLMGITAFGHAVAPTLTMVMAEKLGRKFCLLAIGIPTMTSWALIAISQNIVVLSVARFCGGLSVGFILCFPQMYLGEIASAKLRGKLGMVCGTMINAGLLFSFIIVPYLPVSTMGWIGLGISIVTVISICFIPESPYFLAMVGKFDEAEVALEKLRGKTDVSEELDLIKMTVGQNSNETQGLAENVQKTMPKPERSSAYKKLFTVKGNRKALWINFAFLVIQQLGGYITLMVYGQIIFNKVKSGISGHICIMIMATLQIICNFLTVFIIDKLGRRPLIGISGLVSGFCSLIVGVYFYLMDYTTVSVSQYAIVASGALFVQMIAMNIGIVPLHHVVQSEVLSSEVKELATCVLGVGGGLMSVVGVKSYLTLAETWKFGHCVPFFGFVVITWIFTGVIVKLLPETKGKTLYEIQKDLNE